MGIKKSSKKDKTYEEFYGKERALEIKKKLSESHKGQSRKSSNKGKTYEEIYGQEKALEIKRKMSEVRSGKNHPMYGRKHTDESKAKMSKNRKGKTTGENHPFWGKKHNKKSRKKMSKSAKGKHNGKKHGMYGSPPPISVSPGKWGYRSDIGISVRNIKEANIARLIKFLNKTFEYEQYTFELTTLKTEMTWTPDFYIPEDDLYVEITKSPAKIKNYNPKIKAFRKENANLKLLIIDKKIYEKLDKLLKDIIPYWEV